MIPGGGAEEAARHIKRAQELCLSVGLTAVGEAYFTRAAFEAVEGMVEDKSLDIRVYAMIGRWHVAQGSGRWKDRDGGGCLLLK